MSAPRSKSRARAVLQKLGVFAVAAVISLALGEIVLRAFVSLPMAPFLRDYDPETGVRYKKNVRGIIRRPEFEIVFSTNSRGFRGPEPPPSPDGCVLFLGDSFTEGWGVNDGEEYPALVRAALDERYGKDAVPVINASMSASGNGRWNKLLQGELADYRPRLVVFQACWNDAKDNLGDGNFVINRSGEVIEKKTHPKPFSRRVQPLFESIPGLESSYVFGLVRLLMMPGGTDLLWWDLSSNEPDARTWLSTGDRLFLILLDRCLELCHERKWPTALISVRIGDPRLAEMKKMCEKYDCTLLDVRNREERPELYYEADSHWNAKGHRFMADLVLERLLPEDSPYLADVPPKPK